MTKTWLDETLLGQVGRPASEREGRDRVTRLDKFSTIG
jgi:hypothetical protein